MLPPLSESLYANTAWGQLAYSHGYWPENQESQARQVWQLWAEANA